MERLISGLKLSTTSKGANVTITVPNDEGIFLDAIEPAPGIVTTGVIQTYLDLTVQGNGDKKPLNTFEMNGWNGNYDNKRTSVSC